MTQKHTYPAQYVWYCSHRNAILLDKRAWYWTNWDALPTREGQCDKETDTPSPSPSAGGPDVQLVRHVPAGQWVTSQPLVPGYQSILARRLDWIQAWFPSQWAPQTEEEMDDSIDPLAQDLESLIK